MALSIAVHTLLLAPPDHHRSSVVSACPLLPYRAAHRRRRPRRFVVLAQRSTEESSWSELCGSFSDGFGGWFIEKRRDFVSGNGLTRGLVAGIGASSVVLVAAIAWFSLFRKGGFKFSFSVPFHSMHDKLFPVESRVNPDNDTGVSMDEKSTSAIEEMEIEENLSAGVKEKVFVPVPTDPTQLEALSVLKKLKIVEVEVSADAYCTKREYARWFVKVNHMLERSPKHRIIPKVWLTGSVNTAAFDDVNIEDPDFFSIQSLAEVGIVSSKLTPVTSYSLSDNSYSSDQEKFFSPESFISRLDLVSWKALIEYPYNSSLLNKTLRPQTDFRDLRTSPNTAAQLFVDLMAGDRSVIRRAFGNIRRLQPYKPVTKAQAAVVLTSGRMSYAIRNELSRLEAENLSRLAEIEEIRSELIQRGDIKRLWEGSLSKERDRYSEVEQELNGTIHEFEEEKMTQDQNLAEYVKEKASLDCQQELLHSFREEVADMYDKLANEKLNLTAEQKKLDKDNASWLSKHDAVVEAKSMMEAELEALRILRSWIEEDALQARNRALVLEQAVHRWQHSGNIMLSHSFSSASNDPKIEQKSNCKQS